jgi:hypothetical protein
LDPSLKQTTMKRSSSTAALADPEPESKWNYQDDVLAASMMFVSIDQETSTSMKRNNEGSGSMGSIASSRCSSRGSLSGWGSVASRKSYKVDLASLAGMEDDSSNFCHSYDPSAQLISNSMVVTSTSAVSTTRTDGSNPNGESWGFFVDSAI